MPIISKYQDHKVEEILGDVIDVIEKHKITNDLSLMIMGNVASNIINNLPKSKRKEIAEKFAQALMASVDTK